MVGGWWEAGKGTLRRVRGDVDPLIFGPPMESLKGAMWVPLSSVAFRLSPRVWRRGNGLPLVSACEEEQITMVHGVIYQYYPSHLQ